MARSNPQVDALESQNRMLREQIARMRQDPPDIPFAGCGDSSCITTQGLGGQHTNGGCRCDERALRRAVSYWRDVAIRRQTAIQDMLRGERLVEIATVVHRDVKPDGVRVVDPQRTADLAEARREAIDACASTIDDLIEQGCIELTERSWDRRAIRGELNALAMPTGDSE